MATPDEPVSYRIDELARLAGMTVRNVRVYQDRGLLPAPRREGRVGLYSDAHLARLRLIGQLLERGYGFAHIAELIAAWEQGRDVADLLGLEQAITGPFSDEIPTYVTGSQLVELFGEEALGANLDRSVALGLVQPEGDRFKVPSPRLLQAGAELVAAGIPLAAVLDLSERLQSDMDGAARRLVEAVSTHLLDTHGPGWMPTGDEVPALAELIRRLRPLAQMAVDAHLAHALEAHAREVLGDRLLEVVREPDQGRAG